MINISDLDKRICDVEGGQNTETYREFIINSENSFGIDNRDLNNITEKELNNYLDFLDYLWLK